MKILLFSDLHSQSECLRKIEAAIRQEAPEYAICCGDICQGDDLEYFEKLTVILERLNDAFIITGNNDGPAVRETLSKSKFSSHLKLRKVLGQAFFGISDGDLREQIDQTKIAGSILLTHRPPAREALQTKLKNAPKYHLSGHIHSRYGIFKYPATTHIQIPSLISGRFGLSMYGIFNPIEGKAEFKKIDR